MPVRILRGRKAVLDLPSRTIAEHYHIADLEGTPIGDDADVQCLGKGGFGIVVRCSDALGIPRVLKILDHRELKLPPEELSGDLFRREIQSTNARPFKHVVSVLDYGRLSDTNGESFAYFVLPFVPGVHIDRFFRVVSNSLGEEAFAWPKRDHLHDLLLLLVDDLFAGLVELQDADIVHMDVKPGNLLVLPPKTEAKDPFLSGVARPQLFVIDLGAAKTAIRGSAEKVFLFGTRYYFPRHWLPKGHHDLFVEHEWIEEHAQVIDLYSAGRVLEDLVLDRTKRKTAGADKSLTDSKKESEKETWWRSILGGNFDVIEGLIDKLLADPRRGFGNAVEARLSFQAIGLKESRSILSSELLLDPFHGVRIRVGKALIRIAPPLDAVVAHPAFQRLKRMQQLGLISEVFPDGTHTRFAHSLRTYHVAKAYVLSLNRSPTFRLLMHRRDVDQLLAAALLHDIGQYHFAHALEDLRKMGRCDDSLKQIRHDQELASEVLHWEWGGSTLAQVLSNAGYDVDEVVYMFQKSPKDWSRRDALNLGRDILSGDIDADRIAYLVHDSDRTGVPYGGAIDVGSLIESLTVRHSEEGPDRVGLAIEEGGVSAAEAVMASVYWMYRNVYWRHTNRAFMAIVKYVFRRMLRAGALSFKEYIAATSDHEDWFALEFLHERFRQAWPREVNPLDSLMTLKRLGYKRVLSLPVGGHDDDDDDDDDDMLRMANQCFKTVPDAEERVVAGIEDALPRGWNLRAGEILIDVPLKPRLKEDEDPTEAEAGVHSRLCVAQRDLMTRKVVRWADLRSYSRMSKALEGIEDHSARKIRVFISRQALSRMPGHQPDLPGAVRDGVFNALRKLVSELPQA